MTSENRDPSSAAPPDGDQAQIDQLMRMAFALHQQGRLVQAESTYRRILFARPDHAEALFLMGEIARQTERFDDAIDLIGKAIALGGEEPAFYFGLACACAGAGRLREAAQHYGKTLALDPRNTEARNNLGCVLEAQGDAAGAEREYRVALQTDSEFPQAHYNLAKLLQKRGELEQATAHYRRVLAREPQHKDCLNNLGNVLREKGLPGEAREWYRKAQAVDPRYPLTHWNRALVDLLEGEYERGWEGYEWRWRMEPLLSQARRYVRPRWDGAPAPGQTVLLYGEQGFGDLLQFVRYVPLLAGRCGAVVVLCHRDLRRLFESVAGVSAVVAEGGRMPEHDVRLPLLSAAYLLGTRLETIPREVPYLRAPRECVQRWDGLMAGQAGRRKVGLVWSGSVANRENYARRSLGLSMLGPLAGAEGVTFFSLQKGAGAEQAASAPEGMRLVDVTGELKDFADTAGLISRLDLVISVDTAVAHLAGALGKPVWVLLPYVPDWRWLLSRADSPWYPTMRLFRQQALGEWGGAIEAVAVALKTWAEHGGA